MIILERCISRPVERQKVEIVERKGLGHPDYIADSLAESFSQALVRHYLEEYGEIQHYNVDKLEAVGGSSKAIFGGGRIEKPPMLFFSGRASGNGEILERIAVSSAKEWLRKNLRFLDPETISYSVETKPGAPNLSGLQKIGANDTSIGIGYAPLSGLEESVLMIERIANSKKFKKRFPFSGEDVKVMGIRKKSQRRFIIGMAFVDRFIGGERDYFKKKEEVRDFLRGKVGGEIFVNCADRQGLGEQGCFLTVTGTSLEMGDDGAVGRGNRINGLIPFNRFFSMEAAAGKNIVNHVGKIYNLLAQVSAERIFQKDPGVGEVYVKMLSRIGAPLESPELVVVSTENPVKKDFVEDVLAGTLKEKSIKKVMENSGPVF